MQYKLEVYCGVSLSRKPRRKQGTALQMGGVLRYKLEVYRQYFSDKLYGLGVPKQSPSMKTKYIVRSISCLLAGVGTACNHHAPICSLCVRQVLVVPFLGSVMARHTSSTVHSGEAIFLMVESKCPTWREAIRRYTDLKPCSSAWKDLEAHTIDTEIKAKRNNITSESITFRLRKRKQKQNSG